MFLHLRIRGRAGIPRAKMPMLRPDHAKPLVRPHHSKLVGIDDNQQNGGNLTESSINIVDKINGHDHQEESSTTTTWVPHPRTGIYFPEGNDWVMADVPKTAASFDQTFWLRNDDGVDKPDPENPHYTRF
ncbi:hypothetical protein LWI28_014446 [Acer negundo]|uniref:Uncharacterized protein n=1 Tax=Acer negundo TaxID=4023 RepID=A0AAD5J4B4_ACENE|nr:hypothetical protein LWI28_014446 [Acer negundo]KAK4849432.1 hypothetical protein QYF36_024744 [Acer negundo]